LQTGLQALRDTDPSKAEALERRSREWIAKYGAEFPGNQDTGVLGTSEADEARFEEFADDAPCPALNPETGLCDVYQWRPMTCRVFGPPVRVAGGDAVGCCELCFHGATEEEIAACEMPVPHAMEERLLAEMGEAGETVVAYALTRSGRE
jgi:Fe-S-cluster containining protein